MIPSFYLYFLDVKSRKQARAHYMALWKNHKTLNEEQKKQLELMDTNLDYEEIVLFRDLAHALKKIEKVWTPIVKLADDSLKYIRKEGKISWQKTQVEKKGTKENNAVGNFFNKMFLDDKKKVISVFSLSMSLI